MDVIVDAQTPKQEGLGHPMEGCSVVLLLLTFVKGHLTLTLKSRTFLVHPSLRLKKKETRKP